MDPEAYKNKNDKNATSKWDILTKYDEIERARVEKIKEEVKEGLQRRGSLEKQKKDVPPSTFKKFGRSVLDLVNLKIPAVEERRKREAMSVAYDEIKREDDEREVNRMLENAQYDLSRDIKRFKSEEAAELALKNDMVAGMDDYRRKKDRQYKNDRAQELLERQISERLIAAEELEEQVWAGNPEVEKTSVEFEGEEIPVYNLKGYPFSMLSHAINYRLSDNPDENHIGVQTARRLVEDPSLWAEDEYVAARDDGYGTREGNARGNVISASYINSDSNISNRVSVNKICYGFDHLNGDSIITTSKGDGGTPNVIGRYSKTGVTPSDVGFIDAIEGSENRSPYNEVLLRRYFENGKPRLPDYIIAENGKITDDMKRHAKFFNIPIINIDRKSYDKKLEQRAIDAADSISENSSFEEVSSAIDVIKTTDKHNDFMTLESVGDGEEYITIDYVRRIYANGGDAVNRKMAYIEELEMKKRLDFIEDELKKNIEECKKATEDGRLYGFKSDKLSFFDMELHDVDSNIRGFSRFGDMNYIEIKMRMNGSSRMITTKILDGEHRKDAEEFYTDYPNKKNNKCDSSHYERMMKIVQEYYDAMAENRKKAA